MGSWDSYKYEEDTRSRIEPGDYRVVIVSAEEAVSKSSGKPMIVIGIRPSGSSITIKDYKVQNEYFNQNMSRFFEAFPSIGDGNFNFVEWVGAEGAAHLKPDGDYMRIGWYITPDRAADLPAFVGEKPEKVEITSLDDDSDLPFDDDPDDEMLF